MPRASLTQCTEESHLRVSQAGPRDYSGSKQSIPSRAYNCICYVLNSLVFNNVYIYRVRPAWPSELCGRLLLGFRVNTYLIADSVMSPSMVHTPSTAQGIVLCPVSGV